MPQTITFPFHAIRLTFQGGEVLTAPLTDANALHLKKGVDDLAQKFAKRLQAKVINQGEHDRILNELRSGDFSKTTVTVDFPAAKDGISYPAFELSFDCFYQNVQHGVWGVLPTLGLECMAVDEAQFAERMTEIVRIEFTAKKRLQAVQRILTAMWFEAADMESAEMELDFHSPGELANLKAKNEQNLLSKAATKLEVKDPEAYGRDLELAHMGRILSGRFSKNILLVGASGSGKSALVREVAYRRAQVQSEQLIWETSASRLIKELSKDTGWQDNLSLFVAELTQRGDFLFVKNLAELFEVGRYEGNDVSMADYLRSSIGRGEFTLISECTPEERTRIELLSPNFLSFFQTIELQEPKQGMEKIIHRKVLDIAGKNQVEFEAGAIEEVIRLHRRFMPYSGMPGKPIRFLESVLLSRKEIAEKKKNKEAIQSSISRDTVLRFFSQDSGMPLFLIDPAMPMDVDAIRQKFNQNVFGQERAVEAVTGLLGAVKTALTRSGKPIASFLFVGPTGVGKTELGKVLAEFTFGGRERMVRFDMSEYADPWSVMRLTGQHHQTDGLLTSAVRREPFCVLLFDEIEKAHSTFFDLLLQILGEGRLSDSRGKLVNFCSTIIVMTSNIGAANLQQNRIGWKKELNTDDVTAHFTKEVEKHFKPELFNRIDSVVAFEPLSKETVRYVVEREVALFKKREGIQFRRVELDIEEAVLDYIAKRGYDPRYGARYLQRTLREVLIVPLAKQLNQHEHDDRLSVKVKLENDEVAVHTSSDPMAFDLLMEQWDKLTLAESTAQHRRKMMMVLEGPIFMRLQSELDILEAEKKRLKEGFWQNLESSGQYTHLLSAKEIADSLYQRIQDLEMEMALASMEQGVFQTDFQERMEQWVNDKRAWQLQVRALLAPTENRCLLAIYGSQPAQVIEFYVKLFHQKAFTIRSAQAVWYNEGVSGLEGGYLKQSIAPGNLAGHAFKADDPNSVLYGMEFDLEGDAVQLYLAWELGIQRWEGREKGEGNAYLLMLHEKDFNTPANIFRQSFYKTPKPHRSLSDREFTDQRLGVQAQLKPAERLDFLLEILNQRLDFVLEDIFLGGGPE